MTIPLKINAVVILYNPDTDAFDNIASYQDQVGAVIAIDNSDHPSKETAARLKSFPGLVYFPNHANLGIAAALNIGTRMAIEQDCDFLLTMDQDSKASPDMIKQMLECLNNRDQSRIGMIAPFHRTKSGHAQPKEEVSQAMTPMTSGCLLNLQAFKAVGPFREELFIDFVDNEYCLRLIKHGYGVIQANMSILEHNVGDTKKYGPFIATNHSPLRRYYKTRNRFYVFSRYFSDFPSHCLFDLVRLTKEIASIILFEGEKLAKLGMMLQGWRDFRKGKFGRYER
jgi:rhamnosyltransferase